MHVYINKGPWYQLITLSVCHAVYSTYIHRKGQEVTGAPECVYTGGTTRAY